MVAVCAKSRIPKRKIEVQPWCQEELMKQQQALAQAALLKEDWREHCKTHWRRENRKSVAVVSTNFQNCLL